MSAESRKTRYELTVELVKALIWPFFAFVILFSFWQPLHLVFEQLPDIVSRSETITIAGLSLVIDRNLQLQGQEPSAEVKQALSALTPEGIRSLLALSGGTRFSSIAQHDKNAEMIRLGLFEEVPEQEITQSSGNWVYGIRLTPLGEEAQTYLYALIAQFVQQLPKS